MADKLEQTSDTTREFTLELLEKITNNFSEELIIGSGGYGVVYKGILDSGEEIALKKLHHMPGLADTQFRNEFNNLMRAQHLNITRLVGYCYSVGHQRLKYGGEYIFAHVEERVLCFEYLHGGSLDKHITNESCGFDWRTCYNIIKGVCKGLNYLHNGSKDPIYHLDLKPGNILLDKNMVPKIGDFGLSRLFPSTRTHITGKIIGTPGYMPPEYIERYEFTSKFDVYSLGAIIIRIMGGQEGYSKCANLSSQEFMENVQENWGKRLQTTMLLQTSKQIKTCINIALRCVEVDRNTIAEIVDELNKLDTEESSLAGQVAMNQNWNSVADHRGRIVFSTTSRPSAPLDIFSCPFLPSSIDDELHLTDGVSYNYNGCPIPPAALKALLKNPKLAEEGRFTDVDVNASHVSGLVFISERDGGLETLYIALNLTPDRKVKVFSLADIFGAADFRGARLEDSGCFGGGYSVGSRTIDHSLIYVSTKEPVLERSRPCTVVYKTNLTNGNTERLTPQGVFDLSPAVSPSGKMVAVASFERKSWRVEKSWKGEVESLKTHIYLMNVDGKECQGLGRKLLIMNGGWPSWGSDNIIFHRALDKSLPWSMDETTWGVFRYNISTGETVQVTPSGLYAMTPAAISETKVAVATNRNRYNRYSSGQVPVEPWYSQIEIFDTDAPWLLPVQITQKTRPESHHFNPFVLDGGGRIGYHRCRSDLVQHGVHEYLKLHKLESPVKDVGLYRLSCMFPTISKDGSKLAFVHNFKEVWVSDSQGLRMVYEERGPNNVHGPVWNQNPDKDIMYVWIGPTFLLSKLEIYSIRNVSGPVQNVTVRRLTHSGFSNGFPSSSPDGNKFVFSSTRTSETDMSRRPSDSVLETGKSQLMRDDLKKKHHCNLYIMLNTDVGESEEGSVRRLTNGSWINTHCQWSPNGDWIIFSSTRGKSSGVAAELNNGLRQMYSSYLVNAGDPMVVIRVMNSAGYFGAVFSPDGRSIAVMSVNPISAVWEYVPGEYGNIFVVDIDPNDLKKNKKMKKKKNRDVIKGIHRMTHSRYWGWTLAWTPGLGTDTYARWSDIRAEMEEQYRKREKWRMMGEAASEINFVKISNEIREINNSQ